MPQRPAEFDEATQVRAEPRHPYQVVAATVALGIEAGSLAPGEPAPAATELAAEYGVSLATAKRSLVLLQEWGHVVRLNRNAFVVAASLAEPAESALRPPPSAVATEDGIRNAESLLSFVLRRRGAILARFSSVADATNPAELQDMLFDAVERAGGGDLAEYELDVARPGDRDPFMTFVVSRRVKF